MVLKILLWLTKNRKPFVVDVDYLDRWFVIPRNWLANIYFHRFGGSDAPTPHDHPWFSISIILYGQYIEHTPKGDFVRKKGDITFRMPKSLHWIEIDKPVYTLFITGPRIRNWGFKCPSGWVDHLTYIKLRGGNRLAGGCGETKQKFLLLHAPGEKPRKIRVIVETEDSFYTSFGTFSKSTGCWRVDDRFSVTIPDKH